MREPEHQAVLFQDDFSGFAIGPLPFDREHSATGEYHYVVNPGYQGSWYDPITNCWFRGPNWVVTSQDGMHVMEQMRVRNPLTHGVCSVLAAGDKDWTDYTAEVDLRALCTTDQVGLLFRYQASLQHYAFFLSNQEAQLVKVVKTERTVLAKATVAYSCDAFIHLVTGPDHRIGSACESPFPAKFGIRLNGCLEPLLEG